MTRIIEIYVYADLANDIKTFASNLDRQLRSGFKYRMMLMNVMRWADLDNEAIAYLWQLHQKAPNYPEILEQIVNISRENGQLSMAIDALKHLRQMHPNQSNYGEQLAQLYIESEQYQDVLILYQQLMAQFPNKDYAVLMLKSAINSGQQSLMVEAITVAESIINKSSRLLRNMIDIYLNIEKTQLAFDTGLKYLQHQQNITLNNLNKMLEIAIWTNAPENITRSITLIQNYFPDNKELIQKSAEAYLAINKPKDAYLLYGKIVHHMHNDRGFLLKYMESASFTQVPEIMASAALTSAKLSPSDYLIIEKSVQLLQWTNQPEKAYDIHLQWLKNNVGSTQQVQQLLKLAQESGDPDRVKEAINLCHSHMPQDSGTQLAIAQQAMASGLNKEAIFAYESYLRHNKQNTQIKRQLAELYVWDGQHEMAFALYKELFKTFPDDTAIQNKMIEIAGWTQNADAISYLMAQKANMSPSNYELQVKAGEAHIAAGQTQESIVFFERALEIKPGNLDLLRKLAQYYGWIERYDDIVRILDMIQQYGRLTQKERIQLAVAAMDRNQPKKVISLLEALANKQLLSETSGILLAAAYVQIGQQEKAIRIYKQIASQYQDDPHLITEMGNQLLWMKQHDLALSFFHKALKEDSKHLNALKGCAQIYAWQNQSKKAIKYFERYLTLKPDDYEVRYQIGELLFTSGNKHYAFKHFQKALTLIDRNKRTLSDDAVKQLP
ncbi:MAG: hypothetical protein OMM_03602 [Candidatus Magnetoglobus multicellularis str. Araruama]|uniref:Tetratricopeptide repeat protein n=1 Tax=Candidatus Magnetoglobus multicellularis str. Araruama TaxID=890399 RepID=A0A1V1P552_9BACT|nr:MAG: hypothetical protein OMM_03602 [Candidatus Magnetoglobus multicellularis str. Araruama]